MKPEQAEIDRLKKEVAKLKMERDILKICRSLFRQGVDVKFGFVAKHRGAWPVLLTCEALGVSRSGFYARLTWPRSQRSLDDKVLGGQVQHSFVGSDFPPHRATDTAAGAAGATTASGATGRPRRTQRSGRQPAGPAFPG